jgi:hypothetical protein
MGRFGLHWHVLSSLFCVLVSIVKPEGNGEGSCLRWVCLFLLVRSVGLWALGWLVMVGVWLVVGGVVICTVTVGRGWLLVGWSRAVWRLFG